MATMVNHTTSARRTPCNGAGVSEAASLVPACSSKSRIGFVLTASLLLLTASLSAGADSYDLTFSTYLGGGDWEHARDVVADGHGNIYVVGGTASPDFPTTPGVYSRTLSTGGLQAFGPCDVFVAKFGAGGNLIWSTYVGGPHYDRGYGVEVDDDGYVYVAGRAGPGFPVKNAFQPDFDGVDNGSYGMQNAFVFKLAPDGSDLIWSSYVGVSTLCRDIAIDSDGDVYVPGGRWNTSKTPPAQWFSGAFQKTPPGGESDCGAIKIKGDCSRVLWATWLGGSGQDTSAASIRVGSDGKVYVAGSTFSTDFPTTPGAADRTYGGEADFFVTCLTSDGSDLVYGTYLGGPGNEWISTHNLAVDDAGNAYVAFPTSSTNYPVTGGALQRQFRGGDTDWAVTKLSPTGVIVASTFIGGSAGENADGIYVDLEGNVFVTGETQSHDFPVTANAYQAQHHGGTEAVLVRLSADFSSSLYSTFIGGSANDPGRSGFLGADGCLYVTGASDGAGWPAKNAFQSGFHGGAGSWGNGDCILAKFTPSATIAVDPSVTYQTITGWEATAWVAEPDDPAFPNYRDGLYEALVNDIGINRVRLEIRSGVENTDDNWSDHRAGTIDYDTWRSRRYATVNDDDDPNHIRWAGFHFSEMDHAIETIVNPLRALLEARGEALYVNVNYVAFTGQIKGGVYLHDDPAEYAEFVLAACLHIRDKYGWLPDAWEILLEPDNVSQWNGNLLGRAIAAVGEKLAAHDIHLDIVAPSNTDMGNAITYFDQMMQVPRVKEHLREYSYHRYAGVSLSNLRAIAARAKQHGLTTSMLEWWSDGNTYHTLHEDLQIGNNSAWQQAVVRGFFDIDDSDPANPVVSINNKTKFTRQYFKYIRPGALRIGADSRDGSFEPLAFINDNGSLVVVIKCDSGGEFSVGGLAAGKYGIKYTSADQYDIDLPDRTIRFGQLVTASIPARGVLTIYAKPALPDEQAPSAPSAVAATGVTPSTVELTWHPAIDDVAVAGYKVYRDGARIGFSLTDSYTDSGVEPETGYRYQVSAYDTAGNESALSGQLTVGTPESAVGTDLLGYWKFNAGEGIAAVDSSGHNNDGTLVGPVWTEGKMGLALDFDGVNDQVQIGRVLALDNLDAVTMAAWIYPRVDAHWHVLDKGDGDKRIYAEGTNRTLNGRIRYAGTHAYAESEGNTITLNAWQHVAMAWSQADHTTRLYHNGVEVRYSVQEVGSGSVLDDTTYPFVIGARGGLGEVTFFSGLIDEVRLYGRALSANEVQDLYESVASYHEGDLQRDLAVNFRDINVLFGRWLWLGPLGGIPEDVTEDGVVNLGDYSAIARNWRERWNHPPVVAITAPQDGAQLYRAQPVAIQADASDPDGCVMQVAFLADGKDIDIDSDVADGWSTTSSFEIGSYSLTAKATDNEGLTTTSAAVSIEVMQSPR